MAQLEPVMAATSNRNGTTPQQRYYQETRASRHEGRRDVPSVFVPLNRTSGPRGAEDGEGTQSIPDMTAWSDNLAWSGMVWLGLAWNGGNASREYNANNAVCRPQADAKGSVEDAKGPVEDAKGPVEDAKCSAGVPEHARASRAPSLSAPVPQGAPAKQAASFLQPDGRGGTRGCSSESPLKRERGDGLRPMRPMAEIERPTFACGLSGSRSVHSVRSLRSALSALPALSALSA
eukprot:2944158-Pyramimonas_sp.AAC.1